jgi:Berberine and berberine like
VAATSSAHRESPIMVNVAALFGSPEEAPEHEPWVTGLADALRDDDQGAYVNFLGDEGEDRVRAAYPGETWDRLVAVKRRYDPTNLFRRNQNIPPG